MPPKLTVAHRNDLELELELVTFTFLHWALIRLLRRLLPAAAVRHTDTVQTLCENLIMPWRWPLPPNAKNQTENEFISEFQFYLLHFQFFFDFCRATLKSNLKLKLKFIAQRGDNGAIEQEVLEVVQDAVPFRYIVLSFRFRFSLAHATCCKCCQGERTQPVIALLVTL